MFRFKRLRAPAAVVASALTFAGSAGAQEWHAPQWRPAAVSVLPPGAPAQPAPTAPMAQPAPPALPAPPGAPVAEAAPPGACPGACDGAFDWKKVPRVRPMPRTGFFPVPPGGPGYYSALDCLEGNWRDAPPKYPYPRTSAIFPPFYDLDNFAYLDDPKNTEHDIFDPLKRVHLGDDWLFVTGGEFRTRYVSEQNSRLTRTNNNYDLTRTRVYGDLWYRDAFRVYVEYLGAWSSGQSLAPLPIDRNNSDLLNAFVDVKVADLGGDPTYVRVGRQELLLGSQRLVSPLDWANTRRTFQGVRAFRQSEKFDFDLFWVQPVLPNATNFDSVDNNQNFAGAWATYRPAKGRAIDLYYLMLDNTNHVTQQGIPRGNFTRHTVGSRYYGNVDNFLFDVEGALQFGSQNGRDVFAAMFTKGLGYNFKDAPWDPTFWVYYDYASGGNPTSGTSHTFNQLFPFGHYYLGWADQVGRQNIHDLNFHLYLFPTKWVTTWLQFHSFWLANNTDALYNAAGNAIRRDPTGRSGSHVGEELDAVFNFHLSQHADILTGYSYLWGGEFLKNTAGRKGAQDTGLYYLQFSYKW